MIRGNKPKEGSTHWKTVMTPISTPSPVSGTINNFTQLPLSSNFTSFSGGTKCMPRFGGTGIMGAKDGNGNGSGALLARYRLDGQRALAWRAAQGACAVVAATPCIRLHASRFLCII